MYQYKATLLNVVDGDTVDMFVDMGFNIGITQRMRLAFIDTPELNSVDIAVRAQAMAAKNFVLDTLSIGRSYTIKTYKIDKYGRLLVEIFVTPDVSVNQLLIARGLATPYLP